jgi:hydrogenase maturation protease
MTSRSADPGRVAPVLVLGVGNRLLADDGIGPVLVERLSELHAGDPRVEFVDGGTRGLALLGLLERRSSLLVLDAVALGAEAGHVHVVDDPLHRAMARGASAHEDNVSDLLRIADLLQCLPAGLALVGIEPGDVETRIGFSPAAARALPDALKTAERLLAEMLLSADREELPCTK